MNKDIPDIVFILPYRNRPQHKHFFLTYLNNIMTDFNGTYEIYISFQHDERPFNRGATKNIGFQAIKQKYPNNYKNITLVFNDIDTIPYKYMLNYKTIPGTVKHFYGFEYALGGIVSINAADFERINGFPNLWGWGLEDKILQQRCIDNNITIDRTQFYKIGDPNILHLFDGIKRIVNKQNIVNINNLNGINTIYDLSFTINNIINDKIENELSTYKFDNVFYININDFKTIINYKNEQYYNYDLRDHESTIAKLNKNTRITNNKFTENNWEYIEKTQPTNKPTNKPTNNTSSKKLVYAKHMKPHTGKYVPKYSQMLNVKTKFSPVKL